MPFIQSNLLPRPQRKAAVISPSPRGPCARWMGGRVTEALVTYPFSPSPPWLRFTAGTWKLFLFTQCHQDAAARCAAAHGGLGFPTGSFQRPHAKQPAVLQGASGPRHISLEEALPSVRQVILPSAWGTSLLLGGRSSVVIVVLYSSACQFSSFFLFLLLYVPLPGLTARRQGGQLRGW